MPQKMLNTIENNFSGGLKTEFTGLNFPENACTETDNCVFSRIGEVSRRAGIDFEENHTTASMSRTNLAMSSYKWNNAGGDGNTKIYVVQIGALLHFYRSTDATLAAPLSTTKLATTINLATYALATDYYQQECQYADGNGYLFVFHPNLGPLYLQYNAGTITATLITVKIRDFIDVIDFISTQERPTILNDQHGYNLYNRGWTSAPPWFTTSTTSNTLTVGSHTFTVAAGLPVVVGSTVIAVGGYVAGAASASMTGTVTSYVGTTLVLNITSVNSSGGIFFGAFTNWNISPISAGLLNGWHTALGNYPSNADVWWRFKDPVTGAFDPTTQANVTLGTGPAQSGHFIVDAFNVNRASVSGLSSIATVSTTKRPRTGTWFQGRVWYAGVDGFQAATAGTNEYSWSENIYFSQVVEDVSQFGMAYQNNDPTSEEFFDLLPTDGGVIIIQGAGAINKLFPVQNGLLVFAANGIWFITGSQGIGFTANDYTVTKISSIQSMSGSSFVDLLGFPVFWNEEGIYQVAPAQQGGGLVVNNLCDGTISDFYNSIPSVSKRYARGDYNSSEFTLTWLYRDTAEHSFDDRYNFTNILNFSTTTKAFYPWSVSTSLDGPFLHDIKYIYNPGGGALSAPSDFKILTSYGTSTFTFSEEWDETNWVDFHSHTSHYDYDSYFVTGYKIHGQAMFKFQPVYIQMFSDGTDATAYKIQGIWDYANSPNSGKYSQVQNITNAINRFGIIYRRHRIRGRGMSMQIKVMSVSGFPFKLLGWSTIEAVNAGV